MDVVEFWIEYRPGTFSQKTMQEVFHGTIRVVMIYSMSNLVTTIMPVANTRFESAVEY